MSLQIPSINKTINQCTDASTNQCTNANQSNAEPAYRFENERGYFYTPSLYLYCCQFDSSRYQRTLFEHYRFPFPDAMDKAVNKRQMEHLAGRFVARKALSTLGVPLPILPVGKNRAPQWPVNVSASLSHNNDTAICAAALKSELSFVGVDLESILTESTLLQIKGMITCPEEWQLVQQSSLGIELAMTIVFSIKEAIFKALYPYVGRYFDFSSALIQSIDESNRSVSFKITEHLARQFPQNKQLTGYYILEKSRVISLVFGRCETG